MTSEIALRSGTIFGLFYGSHNFVGEAACHSINIFSRRRAVLGCGRQVFDKICRNADIAAMTLVVIDALSGTVLNVVSGKIQ